MADKKISALTSASTLGSGDYLPLVQSGNTLKIDINTFLHNLPVDPIITQASEAVSSGALSTSIQTSVLTVNTTAYTLAAGTHGQEKIITVGTWTAGTGIVTVTGGKGFTTITFGSAATSLGAAVTLKYLTGFWYVMSVAGRTLPTLA